ncbi:hypothetical protein CY34DRAFT_16609 [Suillus luteus UH-Slu-Lm8-n1]|uniref:Amine oxidase domain-containing protein n=1 Tax=Suillus luteus UH-Slu-Lm8-n1 TaxID=930992 RepID=A0A0D0A332_9AGAM|nr:hypothetical protein CY34DRAFT_16609 [Suillus luteus UH-Slu-Lm8-n1]
MSIVDANEDRMDVDGAESKQMGAMSKDNDSFMDVDEAEIGQTGIMSIVEDNEDDRMDIDEAEIDRMGLHIDANGYDCMDINGIGRDELGSVSILGVTLSASKEAHHVFAPRSAPIPILRCTSSDVHDNSNIHSLPRVRNNHGGAVVAIQSLDTDVEGLGRSSVEVIRPGVSLAQGKVGGRLFTFKFQDGTGSPYNYFNIGAMRFPKISSMQRVFNIFDYPPLNKDGISLKTKVKPFYFVGGGNNNTLYSNSNLNPFIAVGVKAIMDDVIGPFATRLLDDLKTGGSEGWEYMKNFDQYSTRAYMQLKYIPSPSLGLPNKSTSWYDRMLSESFRLLLLVGIPDPTRLPRNGFASSIGGLPVGANEIASCMEQHIRKNNNNVIKFNSRVMAIGVNKDNTGMDIVTDNKDHHAFYPFSAPSTSSNALRTLNYGPGPSVKIGMQFRTAWWMTGKDLSGNPVNIVGGQTYTDRPLRTVVYPSFGSVQAGTTTTLIASYCWTEDATRLGALIGKDDATLVQLVLKELADLHNVDINDLRNQLIEYKGWSWSHDPYTMGAFAFFGPGKFGDLYTSLNNPAAGGYLHFGGKAISVRHVWVEGVLDMEEEELQFTSSERDVATSVKVMILAGDEVVDAGLLYWPMKEEDGFIFSKRYSHFSEPMASMFEDTNVPGAA